MQRYLYFIFFSAVSSRLNIEMAQGGAYLTDRLATLVRTSFHGPRCLALVPLGDLARSVLPEVHRATSAALVLSSDAQCVDRVVLAERESEARRAATHGQVLVLLLRAETSYGQFGDVRRSLSAVDARMFHRDVTGTLLSGLKTRSNDLPDLQGRRLRIKTFYCPPFSYGTGGEVITSQDPTGHLDGVEMHIFLELARRLNFSWEMSEPPEEHKWGKKFDNGSWSGGIMGALDTGQADAGFCYLWVTGAGLSSVDLTQPWTRICNTFLVPRPSKVNQWVAIFMPLQPPVWLAVFLLGVVAPVTLWALAWADRRLRGRAYNLAFGDLGSSVLATLGMLALASHPPDRWPQTHTRWLVCCWAWYCMLITTAYSSTLVAHLSVPRYSAPLDSVEDLVINDFFWEETYLPYVELTFNPENPWHARFIQRFHLLPAGQQSTRRAKHVVPAVAIEGAHRYVQPNHELSARALSSLRVMDECTSRYYIALGLRKRSPLTESFSRAVERLNEAGVLSQITQQVVRQRGDATTVEKLLREDRTVQEHSEPETFTLDNLVGVFFLWGIGITVSSVVFLGESLIVGKMSGRNV